MTKQAQQNDSKTRVSQATWRKWSGRQWKTLTDQAKLYGFPLDSAGIDLPAFAAWFHNFLATNAKKLNAKAYKSKHSAALERWRSEKAKIAAIDRRKLENRYIEIEPLQQFHNAAAMVIRRTRERLERDLEGAAREQVSRAFEDMFDNYQRMTDDFFGSAAKGDECDNS